VRIEDRGVSASNLCARAQVRGTGTERFFGDRPRPCKPSSAPCCDRERLFRGDDAPVKSVCPLGAGVPDDATGARRRIDNSLDNSALSEAWSEAIDRLVEDPMARLPPGGETR